MLVSVSMVERVARALVFQSAAPVAALGPVVACLAVGLALAPACLCLGAFVVSAWHGRCCRARKTMCVVRHLRLFDLSARLSCVLMPPRGLVAARVSVRALWPSGREACWP